MDKDLIIVARPADGFRRCGVHHPAVQTRHLAGTFTDDEVEALMGEPQLIVIAVDPVPAPSALPEGKSGKPAKPAAS